MVNNRLQLNKLALNIKKSKYIIFHRIKINVQTLTLKIDNVIIERVAEFNFLGLTLDKHLTWKCHVNKISGGLNVRKLTKLQKTIIRILSLSKFNVHIEPLFKRLKLLKVNDILKHQELKFYYKYKNNKLLNYLQSLPF